MPRISTKHQVTVPVTTLEEAGLRAGDQVVIEALGEGEVRIRRGALTFESAFGGLPGTYPARLPRPARRAGRAALKVVLDADILIGALDGSDPHHSRSRQLFSGWQAQDATRLISVINLSEVLVAPAAHEDRLRAAREAIGALGVAVNQPSEAIGIQAARLRARHPISLSDAYCLATASRTGGELASFDRKVLRAAEAERIPLAAMAGG